MIDTGIDTGTDTGIDTGTGAGTPQDAAVREAAIDPERSFAVQAPAGSGKTELLTQRFLALLARVREPQQVLAITFTRKATREMADRILERLQAAAAGITPSAPHLLRAHRLAEAVLERDREESWGLLDDPAQLQIHTIDGLCARLAGRGPLQAFSVAGLRVAEYPEPLYLEAARLALEDASRADSGSEARAAFEGLLLRERGNANQLQALLANMLPRRDQWLGEVLGQGVPRPVLLDARQGIELAALENALGAETLQAAGDAVNRLALIAQAADGSTADEFPAAWQASRAGGTSQERVLAVWLLLSKLATQKALPYTPGFINRSVYPGDAEGRKAPVDTLKGFVECWRDDATALAAFTRFCKAPPLDRISGNEPLIAQLRALLALAVGWLNVRFSEQGVCDFQHVAQQALVALGDEHVPGEALLIEDRRLEHILIDEFQDTAQLQFDLVTKLVEGWEQGDRRTLFLVGDPMQSIYGFRKADVSLFERVLKQGRVGPVTLDSLELTVNFRSTATVVAHVNETCAPLFAHESDAIPGHVDYKPAFAQAGPGGAVVTEAFLEGGAVAAVECEAEWIAERVAELTTKESVETVGILARKRAQLEPIARALAERAVPFEAVDVESLAIRPLILDLMTVTRALLHPGDRVAWLALLTAPWCALQADELLALAGPVNHADLMGRCSDPEHLDRLDPVSRARVGHLGQVMSHATAVAVREPLARRVEAAWIGLGGPRLARRPEDLDDADRYFSLLRALEADPPDDFLGQLEQRCTRLYASAQPAAVQLMTIHKAKGLEFDAVFLPGLQGRTGGGERPLFRQHDLRTETGDRGSLLAPIKPGGAKEPNLYDYIGQLEREAQANETKRLLYVAMTRARRYLALSAVVSRKQDGTLGLASGSLMNLLYDRFDAAQASLDTPAGEPLADGPLAVPVLRLSDASPALEGAAEPSVEPDAVTWTAELPARERLALGDALHHWLELLHDHWSERWLGNWLADYRPALRSSLVLAGAPSTALDRLEGELSGLLGTLLRRDEVVALLSGNGHVRSLAEVEYLVPDGRRLRRQIVDLLFQDEAGDWHIIDYKTGRDSEGTRASWGEQLERYRKLIDAAEPGKVVEAQILQATEGRFIDP